MFVGENVITGSGTIDGRVVYVFSQDFTVLGGSVSRAHADKICKIMDLALTNGAPIIGLNDSVGARIQDGVVSMGAYADIFLRNTLASGVVPQISAILGPCAGGAVYSPALTDFIFMVDRISYMFLTGPKIVKAVMAEEVSAEDLGGADVHSRVSGVAHFLRPSEREVLTGIRALLAYLPSKNTEALPILPCSDPADRVAAALDRLMPNDRAHSYDVRIVIRALIDHGTLLEVYERFAPNIITGFARLGGRPVGIVAPQPQGHQGLLDRDAAIKGARFVRFCDSFNIPLVTFVDTPGFLPNKEQEWGGLIRHSAKLAYAYCEASVPKVTIITGNAYGILGALLAGRPSVSDLTYAWPSADLGQGKGELQTRSEDSGAIRFSPHGSSLLQSVSTCPNIQGIIEPSRTRKYLIGALKTLSRKQVVRLPKKHDTTPL